MSRVAVLAFISALAIFAQTADKEAAMGQHLFKELGRKWKIIETPESIAALAQSLSAQRSIEVKIVESDQPLANNFPGGMVYFSTALLQSATRSELAVILAHQIAHITAHHGQTTGTGQPASIPLYFMGSFAGICIRTAEAGTLLPKSLEARSIANEAEADVLAAHYLERAGYEAAEVKPIFDRFLWARPPLAPRKTPTLLR
jgi:predicted Zn-dependent protease